MTTGLTQDPYSNLSLAPYYLMSLSKKFASCGTPMASGTYDISPSSILMTLQGLSQQLQGSLPLYWKTPFVVRSP
jgi:hypothetical protein